MPALITPKATAEEVLDLVEAARYGELDTLQQFISQYGSEQVAESVDEFGLTPLHMAAANGHAEIAKILIEVLPSTSLIRQNERGNTPLHWAALNGHLSILRILTPLLTPEQIQIPNEAGRTALDLAEERATEKTLECAGYILGSLPESESETQKMEESVPNEDAQVQQGVQDLNLSSEGQAKVQANGLVDQLSPER